MFDASGCNVFKRAIDDADAKFTQLSLELDRNAKTLISTHISIYVHTPALFSDFISVPKRFYLDQL